MALSPATKSAIWLRQFLQELGMGEFVSPPTRIYGDNNTANQWVDEEKITQENMGILQGYHYVKEMAATGQIEVKYVNTKFNLADLFTTGRSAQGGNGRLRTMSLWKTSPSGTYPESRRSRYSKEGRNV